MPRPPFCQGPPHTWSGRTHPWPTGLEHKRRFMFWRFAGLFAILALLFLAALTIALLLALGPLRAGFQQPAVLLLAICAVPLAFFTLASLFGGLAFRRIGYPIAEVMTAADAVAEGDLKVRVRTDLPGEFGRLANSFNRMAAELERAEQQRRNLTADVAHELRTPLHIIQGNLEGVLDGVYEPSPQHISATLEETQLLARLVNDLQTLSLAEAGQLPLHPAPISAPDLLSDVAVRFSGQAAEQGVDLVVEVKDEGEPMEVFADPDRIDQVLSNLLANALRYTPAGGRITLRAELAEAGIRLTVEDSGEGIPAEDLPYVFDRFWRGDRSRARSGKAGTGLGLAIARQLVQANGGTIEVDSQPGQGASFTIHLNRVA